MYNLISLIVKQWAFPAITGRILVYIPWSKLSRDIKQCIGIELDMPINLS